MNKIYIVLILIVVSLSSCEQWLELEPQNDQISDNFWQTKEEVEAVLGAGYVTLRDIHPRLIALGEARGGSLSIFNDEDADLRDMNRWNITQRNEYCKWNKFYEIINYANSVIQYGPDVVLKDQSFNESVMKSFLSEAYFLRALSYFYLVRNFRDVPLITEAYVTDAQDYEIPKSSEAVVLNQITKDLTTALPSSKEVFPELWESKGRATRWAIKALLADVYLWKQEYDSALFQLNDVIGSGRVGFMTNGLDLEGGNRWFKIFSEGTKSSDLGISNGIIFELQFDATLGQTNGLRGTFGGSGTADYLLSSYQRFQFELEPDDLRGLGATYQSETSSDIWKYVGLEAGGTVTRTTSDQNFILYRMADIHLMRAEALAMKNNFTEAMEEVKKIRTRAGLTAELPFPSTQLEALDYIFDERAKEFVGEGKRWYDLMRLSRVSEDAREYMKLEVLNGAPVSASALILSKLFDEDSYFLPIHIDELRINRRLIQNPYYETLN